MGLASVRLLRRERGWTLDVLAERADTTKSYLSKIERGQSTPSIAVAMKLAAALQIDVAELFGETDRGLDLQVTRAGEHDAGDVAAPSDGSSYRGLANRVAGKRMVPFLLSPTSSAERCTYREHDGDEFVVVLAGEVELSFPGRTERLVVGDSAYFRGGAPHHFRSVGDGPAQVLAVIAAEEQAGRSASARVGRGDTGGGGESSSVE